MKPISLTTVQGGISRLRLKGAALKSSLYDLLNAYVTMQGTIKPRGGTIRNATVSQNTKGLIKYQGIFHVFSNAPQTVPAGYQCHVLVDPNDSSQAIAKIHFVAPFMGFLYVVPEFANGDIAHYWLQTNGVWKASTVYKNGDFVSPTTDNGFGFAATRLMQPYSTWQAESATSLNQIIEPTTYTGYVYKAIAVAGASPHTSQIEPSWPTVENGQIQEFGDFGTTATAALAGDTTTQTPGSTITDRYGNPAIFSSQLGAATTTETTVAAQTTVGTWRAGTLYQPGAVVQPTTGQGAFINAIPNGDFEAGNDGNWIFSSGNVTIQSTNTYQGTNCLKLQPGAGHGTEYATMNTFGAVTPGQSVTASCYVNPNNSGANLSMSIRLEWYNSSDTFISETASGLSQGGGYRQISVTGVAPVGAAHCRVRVEAQTGTSPSPAYADIVVWNLETPAAVSNFLYEAVEAAAGTSGSTEPTWPTVAGNTVVDNGVTWQAIGTSIITWQALPIMKSGSSEPTWPTTVGGAVADGNMTWTCADRRVTDSKCPNTKFVAINSSKIFCGDKDIVAFCATTNPLDWSSANDAGFIPFGLQNFGSENVAGLNLYRSNLMIFNGLGYQMWQTDENPTNITILDAQPIGCVLPKTIMPVNNDLCFLNPVGIRTVGVEGVSGNLQAGNFGKAVDPLVKGFVAALGSIEARALFYPGTGQYWLILNKDVVVLTVNGGPGSQSWSRFSFPYTVTDWTVGDGVLYLRTTDVSGDFVWQYDEGTIVDDSGGNNLAIPFLQWFQYLDLGTIGASKMVEGFDMACNGTFTLSFGYNQKDTSQVTPGYTIVGDTLDNNAMMPFPLNVVSLQARIAWASGQAWEWQAMNIYLTQEPKE